MTSNSTTEYIHKIYESRIFKRDLYIMSTVTLFITAETMESTQVSDNRWMDKLTMVYTHNGVLFSLKKEGDMLQDGWNKDINTKNYETTMNSYISIN